MAPDVNHFSREWEDQKQNGTQLQENTIKQLIEKHVILPNWNLHVRDPEFDNIIIQAASDRQFWQTFC